MPINLKEENRLLHRRVRELESTLDNLPTAVGLFSICGRPIFMNSRFRNLHEIGKQWSGEDVTFEKLIANGAFEKWKRDPAGFFDQLRKVLKEKGSFSGEMENGERVVGIHDVLLEGDVILTMQEDITDRVKADREIRHLARHDNLTDLPNRAAFNSEVDGVRQSALIRSEKFAVLAIDVDRFKDINDVFGHAAGDAVLGELAYRFTKSLGPDDFVARLGGDEFMIISCGVSQPEAAAALASTLAHAVDSPVEFEGQALKIGISIGIAVYPSDGGDCASLLKSADAALYRAKAEGRGTVRTFDPLIDSRIRVQRQLLQDLRNAVSNGELELRYQPQASVDRDVYGFEALVRWKHPENGLISPDDFIPLAEESGLIVDIGEWVLREACREAATWRNPLRISVNLSPIQFRFGDLAATVATILGDTGLDPLRLELEITEGVLIKDPARAVAILHDLKSLGVKIAMDDFGTGYSSLSYLQAFPFDTLKIDKSFVRNLEHDRQAGEIVRAVVGLGKCLNIPIVAEGVETEDQMAFLAATDCESVQGYLIGKPCVIENYSGLTAGMRDVAVAPVAA